MAPVSKSGKPTPTVTLHMKVTLALARAIQTFSATVFSTGRERRVLIHDHEALCLRASILGRLMLVTVLS